MNQTIKLDTRKREGKYGEARIAPLRRGERNNAMLTVKICANGQPYDLSGKTASLVATTAAGKLVGPCPMEVAEAGIARIMLPAALYSAVGAFSGYIEIREGETLVDTTDSFGGKVIECADLDAEQAAEFTPLLGELQNAVAEEAKRVEAEKARAQAETERETGFAEAKQASQAATKAANDAAEGANLAASSASIAAESASTAAGKANDAAAKAESDVRAFVNAAGTAVGDAIAAAREDVDAAVKRSDAATAKAEAAVKTADSANTAATKAVGDARDAIADVKATEAKLYPVAENILVGSETGAVAHVEDAFAGATLRKIVVEGACKQDVTTGKNLVDAYNKENESGYLTVDGTLKADSSYVYHVSDYVPVEPNTTYFVTMSRTTNTSAPAVCEYDSGKAFVAGHNRLAKGAAFTTASNTAFVRVSCKTDEPDVIQLEKGSAQTAYEPYSGGKPSPSPEWPQQITVVENPAFVIAGRNLLDPSKMAKTWINYVDADGELQVKQGDARAWAAIPEYGVLPAGVYYICGDTIEVRRASDRTTFTYTQGKVARFKLDTATSVIIKVGFAHPDSQYPYVSHAMMLASSSKDVSYAPHTSQTLTFTLPSEHPYLAKLPDGTADEIVVDKDGNVELVARVFEQHSFTELFEIKADGADFQLQFIGDIPYRPGASMSNIAIQGDVNATNAVDGGVIFGAYVRLTRPDSVVDLATAKPYLDSIGAKFYACTSTETRYPLGKIDMPKAQDSIVNAWTNAEVIPNTSIEYTRDVNIVIADLETAIASITQG